MHFVKKRKIMGVSLIALIGVTSLTGCNVIKDLKPLPDEQRYHYIDRVLSDIDYQNIGEVTFEEKDNGDGVFAPSYKRIGIKGSDVFEKIAKKLASQDDPHINHDCVYYEDFKDIDQYNCSYYGTVIRMGKSDNGASIMIVDSTSGSKS